MGIWICICTRTIARVPRHADKQHDEQDPEIRRQTNLCMMLCCSAHHKLFVRDGRTRHSHEMKYLNVRVCARACVRACVRVCVHVCKRRKMFVLLIETACTADRHRDTRLHRFQLPVIHLYLHDSCVRDTSDGYLFLAHSMLLYSHNYRRGVARTVRPQRALH